MAPAAKADKPKPALAWEFMNITNPEQTKNPAFRTKVARQAMINRPDGAPPKTKASAKTKSTTAKARPTSSSSNGTAATTRPTTSSSTTLLPQHRTSTSSTSTQGHKNSLTSLGDMISVVTAPQYACSYQQESPPALEFAIASPESAGLSPPVLGLSQCNSNETDHTYVSFPQQAAEVSYFDGYNINTINLNEATAQYGMYSTSPPILTSPTEDGEQTYSASLKSTSIDSTTSSKSTAKRRTVTRSGSNETDNTKQVRSLQKKTFRRKHNPEVTTMMSGIPDYVVNPSRSVGAFLDPFDALPVKSNAHTQELLYQYVNAYLMSPQLGERGSPIHTRLTLSRQKLWWPMVMRSKAALCALIAYIETTPDLPIKATSPDYLTRHQSAAIRAIHDSLTEAKNEMTDDEICFAIVLLMIAAQRQNDKQATKTHAQGLKTILARRAKMFDQSRKLENATAEKGTRFPAADNGGDPAARCLYCRGNMEKESGSRESSPELPDVPTTLPPEELGQGFFALIENGMLSYEMTAFVETSLKWNEIAQEARRDRLSAACGASHAWTDGNIKDEARTPFDMAVMFTVRITLYLSAWLDWNHSCQAVKKMVGAVNMSLKAVQDMDACMQKCPDVILWSALLTGPYTEDATAREFMLKLAGRASESLVAKTGLTTFDEILTLLSNKYLWTSTMTPAARTFFYEGLEAWRIEHGAQDTPATPDFQQYLNQLDSMKSQQNNHEYIQYPGMMNTHEMDAMNDTNFAAAYQQQGLADITAVNRINMNTYSTLPVHDTDFNHMQQHQVYLNDVMHLPQMNSLSLQDHEFLDLTDDGYVLTDHNGMHMQMPSAPLPPQPLYERGFVMDMEYYDPTMLDVNGDLVQGWMDDEVINGGGGHVANGAGMNGFRLTS